MPQTLEWQSTPAARTLLSSLDPAFWALTFRYAIPADYEAWEPRNEAHLPEAARKAAQGAFERLTAIRARHYGATEQIFRMALEISEDAAREVLARDAQAMTVSDAIGAEFARRSVALRSVAA